MLSRNNIWVHVTIALALVMIAALAGGVRRSRMSQHPARQASSRPQPAAQERKTSAPNGAANAEVLVRFRSGTTREAIDRITAQFNDEIEDRIESVDGLEVIEDEDGTIAADVLAQYRALPEVEYAEANSAITLDHEDAGRNHVHAGAVGPFQ